MEVSTTEIEKLYRQQWNTKDEIRRSTIATRIGWLKKLKGNIIHHEEDIKEAIQLDFRKNPLETEITEILAVLLELKEYIQHLSQWAKPKAVGSPLMFLTVRGQLRYEPKGNTLIITPWNYPFQLPLVHLISSVAAGNTVILKLSESCPNINKVITTILTKTFDPKHVAVVEGEIAETTYLLSLKFDHIHFTGSSAVGKIVMQAAAKHLADITLELGGKSPVFIDKHIDITQVVKNIIWAKFVNMGQTCIAPDYLLVDKGIALEFEETFKTEMQHAFAEHLENNTDLARIINHKQFVRLHKVLEELKGSQTEWIIDGMSNEEDLFIHPTVLKNMPLESEIMTQEIFGPILPIIYYDDIQEAIDIVASKEKPLALYIFSKSKSYVDHILQNTTAGGTTINDAMVHILHPNLPFAGVNNSGIGQSLGYYGFKSFSHERAIANVKIFPMSKLFWYPYTTKTKKIVHLIKKFFT